MNATQESAVARDPGHVGVWFADSAARHGDLEATRIRAGSGWVTQTYAALADQVTALAARLIDLGVEPGDRVALFAPNRPEWTACDLACASVRAISVPLYSTSTPDQVRHIMADSTSCVAFVAGALTWGAAQGHGDAGPPRQGLLNLLGPPWGETRDQTGRERGSFAEVWRLRWRLDVR